MSNRTSFEIGAAAYLAFFTIGAAAFLGTINNSFEIGAAASPGKIKIPLK